MNEQLAVRVTTNVQRRYANLRRGAWRLIRRIKMLEEENAQAGAYAAILEKDVAGCVDAVSAATAQLRQRIGDLEDEIASLYHSLAIKQLEDSDESTN